MQFGIPVNWLQRSALLGLTLLAFQIPLTAQDKSAAMSDAQVQANVLKALAAAPQLSDQQINTTTVYGEVTLSGSVRDEPTRVLAETLASKASGVKKVIDELTLLTDAPSAQAAMAASNPPQNDVAMNQQPGQAPPPPANGANQAAPAAPTGAAYPGQPYPNSAPGQASGQAPSQLYGQPSSPPYGQAPPYGQTNQPPYGQQPYGAAPNSYPPAAYPPASYPQGAEPYGAQKAGVAVVIPPGSMIRMRINQGLDSKHAQVGATFDGTVLNDVIGDGDVAIPRGAAVQGSVVDVKSSGPVAGRGELQLQLTQVILAGKAFPLVTDHWSSVGPDKAGRTVNNAIGLGALGAIIGAVAGGGPGAAIGAGAGAAAGIGTSAASRSPQALIPPEAILTFHTTQPAQVTTVSQAEMDRLGYGVPAGAQQQPRLVRRPGYYGPGYYPRPAYYPYPY